MTVGRVGYVALMFAAALSAGTKMVGGPFVVNANSRGATIGWIVESDQVTFHARGHCCQDVAGVEG